MRVRTHERERIARTLHDTFLQSVQALVLRLHVLMGRLRPGDDMRAEMEAVLSRAEGVIDEGRARVQQLRAPSVWRGMLADSLADAGRVLAAGSGVCFETRCLGQPRQLKPEVEDELFAIGREALSNAFRHAGAATVRLELDFGDAHARLEVTDDGRGVPDDVLKRGARHGHWGLTGCARAHAWLAGRCGSTVLRPVPVSRSTCP